MMFPEIIWSIHSSPLIASIFSNLFLFFFICTVLPFYLHSHNFDFASYRTPYITELSRVAWCGIFFHLYQSRALKSPRWSVKVLKSQTIVAKVYRRIKVRSAAINIKVLSYWQRERMELVGTYITFGGRRHRGKSR